MGGGRENLPVSRGAPRSFQSCNKKCQNKKLSEFDYYFNDNLNLIKEMSQKIEKNWKINVIDDLYEDL